MDIITDPIAIEKKSFEIITELLGDKPLGSNASIIKRVIHTTADFDYVDNLAFSDQVFDRTVRLLKQGNFNIVTDTRMAESGINKRSLEKLGGAIHCFIDSPDVRQAAQELKTTRSAAAVDYAVSRVPEPTVFVVGNAPTALIRLHELIVAKKCRPKLVIGVPVGFVNVVESKEMIMNVDVPYIVARGRKGGSNVAAAIVNAMMYEADARGSNE